MAIEAYKGEDGTYHWRLRDENGEIVKFRPGRIHFPPDPEAEKRSRAAVQQVLEKLAKAAGRAGGA